MRNCLTYALGRWVTRGGYIVVRRSLAFELFDCARLPWWHIRRAVWLVPHFLHRDYSGRLTQYVPTHEQVQTHKHNIWRFWLSLWHFRGQVIEGDLVCEKLRTALAEDD